MLIERLARLGEIGDQLEAFSRTVDFKAFRPDLKQGTDLFRQKYKVGVHRVIRKYRWNPALLSSEIA